MSSGALGGASQRMPNQANGYSRKYCRRSESGKACRQMLREPSDADEVVAPDLVRLAVLVGEQHRRAVARDVARRTTSLTPNRTSPPSRSRASARSMNTSVCG